MVKDNLFVSWIGRTNFNSSVVVQTGTQRRATVWNGFEPASSELRDAMHHIVNPPLGWPLKVLK